MIRIFDIVFSGVAIIILLPLFLIVAVILRCTGEGEVFYKQSRVGFSGKIFSILKFATMLKNSPNMATGNVTVKNDPRVLPLGKILRSTKVNELPQLLNVFIGDMSLIGPRPLTPDTFNCYPEVVRPKITSVRPGLSGVGSVFLRSEEILMSDPNNSKSFYRQIIAPYKADLEMWFVANYSLATYFKCIFATVVVVLLPQSSIAFKIFRGIPQPPNELMNNV